MKLSELLFGISGDLSLVKQGNTGYVYSDYHAGDEGYDFGIYTSFSLKDLENGTLPKDSDLIPDYLFDNLFDTFKDLLEEEGIDEETLKDLDEPYYEWYDKLHSMGMKDGIMPCYLKEVCAYLQNTLTFEPETIEYEAKGDVAKNIHKYRLMCEGLTDEKSKKDIERE